MKRLPLPLYAQILLWLGMNLAVLALAGFVLLGGFSGGLSWDGLVRGPLGDRPQAVTNAISEEINRTDSGEWTDILSRFQHAEGVTLSLLKPGGEYIAGSQVVLPTGVLARLAPLRINMRDDAPPGFRRGGGGGAGGRHRFFEHGLGGNPPDDGPPNANDPFGPFRLDAPPIHGPDAAPRQPGVTDEPGTPDSPGAPNSLRTPDSPRTPDEPPGHRGPVDHVVPSGELATPGSQAKPPQFNGMPPPPQERLFACKSGDAFWFVIRVPIPPASPSDTFPRQPAILVAHTTSLLAFASFTGLSWWPPVVGLLLVLSALLWWPLIRSITRDVQALGRATQSIAAGNLAARVDARPGDELGHLAAGVNHMAARLERFVKDERRFMGDIAHELSSPLARAQMSLSLLERKVENAAALSNQDLADVQEEIEQMSALVGELLSFSRAAIAPRSAKLTKVDVQSVALTAIDRERAEHAVQLDIAPGLSATADEDLLTRALANLIRNAIRYASDAGPITVTGRSEHNACILQVQDQGPGVPPDTLARLGDPFYRPESARSRETGGAGLGLAIVQTCLTAMNAQITFQNRSPKGFQATIKLPVSG
jgi:two-component system sensor histidine kinase CpxA